MLDHLNNLLDKVIAAPPYVGLASVVLVFGTITGIAYTILVFVRDPECISEPGSIIALRG